MSCNPIDVVLIVVFPVLSVDLTPDFLLELISNGVCTCVAYCCDVMVNVQFTKVTAGVV